jgi:hypothetical protein
VNVQLVPLIEAGPRSVAPSKIWTEATPFVSLTVPDSTSVLSFVRPPLLIVDVSPVFVTIVELKVRMGPCSSTRTELEVVASVAAPAVTLAVSVYVLSESACKAEEEIGTVVCQVPSLCTIASAAIDPSVIVTCLPAAMCVLVPLIVRPVGVAASAALISHLLTCVGSIGSMVIVKAAGGSTATKSLGLSVATPAI